MVPVRASHAGTETRLRSASITLSVVRWVVRSKRSDRPIGLLQATVRGQPSGLTADISWVVAPEAQGQGAATEAARGMISWLGLHGVNIFSAFIHPEH